MRRVALAAAAALMAYAGSLGQVAAAGDAPSGGDEATFLDTSAQWFFGQREAPNEAVNGDAFAALLQNQLPSTNGSWTEVTKGPYFTDSPTYAPVGQNCGANCFQNSGSGDSFVSGRIAAVAVAPNGDVYAGGADGGLWKSTNGGSSWTSIGDSFGTLSIGAITTVGSAGSYTVFAGTGEANTNSDSYAGIGVLMGSGNGSSWTLLPSTAVDVDGTPDSAGLNGANAFRLVWKDSLLYAATSHGLYRINPGVDSSWTRVLDFDSQHSNGGTLAVNLRVWNMITDVVPLPRKGHLLAAAGWRAGEPTNGLYETTDGGNTFTYIPNPQGFVTASQQGRITLAASGAGDRLYAIVQNANAFVRPNASGTILAGVFESASGSPAGPWTRIADSGKLSSSGSAMARAQMRGYKPGVQAWYNQFLAVDPANADHVYLGLEEVYETLDAGISWNTIGPYWNLTLPCFSYTTPAFEGTCNHRETHSDQHAIALDPANNRFYIGNDGGAWSKAMDDHVVGNWRDLNLGLDTLQYYSAAGDNFGNFYGGLQDNGTSRTFPALTGVVADVPNSTVQTKSVQVFGGDGGYTLVDPNNTNNVITEYVDLISARSNDGGRTWVGNGPADPNPRFIAPIVLDHTVPVTKGNGHIVAGGAYVWDSTRGFNTNTSDWTAIYDLTQGGLFPSRQATAISTVTVNGVTTTWVGWCGPCNASFATGKRFSSGIVELRNSGPGTSYTLVASLKTGAKDGLPNRYVGGLFATPGHPDTAYAAFSGYSRKWMVGPDDDPGVGHAWQLTTSGTSFALADLDGTGSRALIDAPASDILVAGSDVVVGTDFGVYVSKVGSGTWSRLGGNLPNVVIDQLGVYNGQLLAVTHGRGLWTFPTANLPSF